LRPLIGFTPANLSIFKLAFSHQSNPSDKVYAMQNNERLEVLGDAVLGTIVAEYLFKKYPNSNEGFLTKMRSKIVKRKTLNDLAQDLGLDVILSDYSVGVISNSMAGNAFEALIGAIYLDGGYVKAKNFIVRQMLLQHLDLAELETLDDNYKSQLLEWSQKSNKSIEFKLLSKTKTNGRDLFKMAVTVNEELISEGEAYNKKSAEQKAAQVALRSLKVNVL
jgi:ribonuclease-3